MTRSFALDKANAKMMGVCAGLAETLGVDVTLLRLAAVLSVFALSPVVLPLYLVAGLVAPNRA